VIAEALVRKKTGGVEGHSRRLLQYFDVVLGASPPRNAEAFHSDQRSSSATAWKRLGSLADTSSKFRASSANPLRNATTFAQNMHGFVPEAPLRSQNALSADSSAITPAMRARRRVGRSSTMAAPAVAKFVGASSSDRANNRAQADKPPTAALAEVLLNTTRGNQNSSCCQRRAPNSAMLM